MDLQQLRNVQEVARCGSISRAAKNLYMSQPNLSKSIRELEEELGIPLFRRTVHGVEITLSGEQFLQYARNILAQMDKLSSLYHNRKSSDLSLSVCVPRASYIAHAFNRWLEHHATGRFHLLYQETNPSAVLKAVSTEEAQLGIVRYNILYKEYYEGLMLTRGLQQDPLWEYEMVLLMHKDHPLADSVTITPEQLAVYPEIVHGDLTNVMPPEESAEQQEWPHSDQGRVEVFDRAGQFGALCHIPGSYMWVSPMPEETLSLYQLIQRPCTVAPVCRDTAVWRGALSDAASELLDEVREEIGGFIVAK